MDDSKHIPKSDCSKNFRPKRFLTAYNFFFKHERAAFDKAQDGSDPPKKKRKREPKGSKGRENFSSLSKRIGAKWKGLSAEERKVFEDMANKDLARYQRDVDAYKKMLAEEDKKVQMMLNKKLSSTECHEAEKMSENTEPMNKPPAQEQTKSDPQKSNNSSSHKTSVTVLARANNDAVNSLNPGKILPYLIDPCHAVSTEKILPQAPSSMPEEHSSTENDQANNTGARTETQSTALVPSMTHEMLTNAVESIDQTLMSPNTAKEKDCSNQSLASINNEILIDNYADDNLCHAKIERKMGPFVCQTNKLYGRRKHISAIMDTYRNVRQSKGLSQIVMVSGYSGAGKSALVQQAQNVVTNMGGNFICGKFDHFRQMEPLSAIAFAFTDFCSEIATKEVEQLHQTKLQIEEKVGRATAFLANVIPTLCQVIQIPNKEAVKVEGMEALHRLKHVFQLFVRAIATPSQPLVLFLDDLQWADPLSLELIESLVTDIESRSFLIIGSYRDNEVDKNHPLATQLRSIESKQVKVIKIEVGDLTKEDTNELISDMIQTPPHMTQSLTNAVYRKTSGNVLFILQFLSSICDEGHLFFSPDSEQWHWDTAMIESKNIADDTVGLMLCKILKLPTQTQSALKLMACLGYCCEEFFVSSMACGVDIGNFGCTDLIASLESAITEGLLDHVGSNYKFSHDQIQLAAYSLIPEKERGNWHFWIGSQVWANKSASPEKALFIVVGQLNKGSSEIKKEEERIQLARLNLQAAQKSKSFAAFSPAAFYLNTAISLLDKNSWADHYDLCLELYTSCAEAEYCIGSFDEMNKKLKEVFANASCLDHELDAFFTLVCALNAQNKVQQASDVGLLVLSQLGESFPTYSDIKSIVMVEFAKAKQMIGGKNDDELLTMTSMDDGHKVAAMRLMYMLAHITFLADKEVFALIVLRMVQASMSHGICDESAYCFAVFGTMMSGVFKDMNGAYRFGQLSLRLLDRSKTKKCLPGVYTVVYTFINPGVHHYEASLGPLEHAYNTGMICGDVSLAMCSIRQYCIHAFHCGEELSSLEAMFRQYNKKMLEHKQEIYQKQNLPYWQAVLNLMGQSDDPEQLYGEVMNQDHLLKEALESKRIRSAAVIYHVHSWLAYVFGNYDFASRMMERRQAIPLLVSPPFLTCSLLFVEGLVSFAMAHKMGEAKWKIIGDKSIEDMKNHALHAPSNCQHKLLLLQAESAFLLGEINTAAERYEDAISTADKNGFIQDQALAYERAGIFYSKQGNTLKASHCYGQARSAYLKWGAKRKADYLCLQCQLNT